MNATAGAEQQLKELGVNLPAPPEPFGAYAKAVRTGSLLFLSASHGRPRGGLSWAKVILILQAKGYNVTAVQNPLTSFADDVAATNRALALQEGPVILVGHPWEGVVITEAGMDPKVVGLVYVAAFAPDQREAVGELGKSYPPPSELAAPIVDKEGFLSLSTEAVVKHFASDLPASEARVVAATQRPIHGSAFGAKVSAAAWKTKPSWYIVSKLDEAIAPDEEHLVRS